LSILGLGDDSKLPLQLRLLTAASKQQNSKDSHLHKSLQRSLIQSSLQSSESKSYSKLTTTSLTTTAVGLQHAVDMKLSDYMYLDKNQAMQRSQDTTRPSCTLEAVRPVTCTLEAVRPATCTGFSIAEIMKH
jgi:hypothetical protein